MATQQTASMEDYLEAIVMLSEGGKVVKVTEISNALGVKKPSVTSALTRLSELGLVTHERYGSVELTHEGERIALDVYWRHKILRLFLVDILNVDPVVAEGDACRMEHVMDREILDRLALFAKFVRECPRAGNEWIKNFSYFFSHGGKSRKDVAQIERWAEEFKERVTSSHTEQDAGGT